MLRILYVDDEAGLLEIGKIYLENTGQFSVDTITSATEALSVLDAGGYNAIVSDYQMPGMDGIAFLKAVRARSGDIPFILFTGRGREEVVIEAINNGADFYLQKGGDPSAQFAELSHKIRQAAGRRDAELALKDSEKRLADIIDFLPDATFAIDRAGKVIAWNRAIEEMTGVPAAEMLGKGGNEYAIPFYGERRKILIDLVFEPDDVIREHYANISRKKGVLTADTNLPRPKGRTVTLMGKASPLYDRQGQIVGAIESIRDITDLKNAEKELREQYDTLAESEQQIRENELRLTYMLGFHGMAGRAEKELLAYAVEGAGAVTGSPLGYLAFLNDDETVLTMYAWSKAAMAECAMQEKPIIYPVEKTGLWGEAVRQRRPIITNDYAAPDPVKKGYPAGHPEIFRHMNVPVMDGSRIVIVAGVANKPQDYTENEVRELTLLMQGLWQVLKVRRAEEELRAASEQLVASGEELRGQYEELAAGEQRIRESEVRFRELADLLPQGIFEAAPDGRMLYVNRRTLEMSGYTPADIGQGVNAFDFIAPPDRQRAAQIFKKLVEEGTRDEISVEYLGQRKDGTTLPVSIYTSPILRNGTITGVRGIIIDITDRKKAEEALRESEAKFRTVVETAEEGIWIIDRDFSTVFTNRKMEEIFGYPAEEMAGRPVWDFVPPEETASIREELSKRPGGIPGRYERRWVRKDKKIIWCLTAATPLLSPEGTFTGSFGMFTDITGRKEMEDALRESEAQYRTVVEQSNDAIFIAQDGTVVFSNPALSAMTGYSGPELAGRSIADLIAPEDRDMVVTRHRERLGGKNHPGSYEFSVLHRDGATRIRVLMNVSALTFDKKPATLGTLHDVTEERRREAALRESEAALRSIIENVQDIVYRTDVAGTLTMASPSIAPLLGYDSLDECIGRNIAEQFWMDPGSRQEFLAALQREGSVSGYEIVLKKKDGTPLIVSASSHFYHDRDGTIAGVEGIFHDITAVRAAEQQIRLLAGLNDISPASVIIHTPDGQMLYANQRTFDMHGWTRDEFMALNLHQLDVPESEALINQRIEDLRHHGEAVFEVGHFRKDGSIIPLNVNAKIMRWNERDVIMSVAIDISGMKQAESRLQAAYEDLSATEEELRGQYEELARSQDQLRQSEERYRRITDNAQDMIYRMSLPDGRYEYVSPASIALTGYTPEEFYASPGLVRHLIHPAWQEFFRRQWGDLLHGKVPPSYEYRIIDRSGRTRWLHQRNVLITDSSGRPAAIEGFVTDITERRLAEEALRMANRKLNLLSSITRHDILNKISVILGFLKITSQKCTDPTLQGYLETIESAVKAIRSHAEFTGVYQNLGTRAPQWIELDTVMPRGNVPAGVTLDAAVTGIAVYADLMLEKVFYNLLDNAVRHGDHVTEIRVSADRPAGDLLIVWEDNGAGIPVDEKAQIFERGYGKNNGFGLFLSREILAITGMTIRETGEPGRGARFEITVPEGAWRRHGEEPDNPLSVTIS